MTEKTKASETKTPDEIEISYKDRYGVTRTHKLMLPIRHGSGEAVINQAEAAGCPDIDDVREQLRPHYAE